MPTLDDVLAIIMGGGRGVRLYPLTKLRAKPAVPIAGKYRLIDVPLSNCINSGIFRIAVLTQFHSVSLHRHITNTYRFDNFHSGWVQILAAEQTLSSDDWYQGTADAVRKQTLEIQAAGAEYVLILAGDHLYRMDYEALCKFHWENEADITVAVQPVTKSDAARFGILKREKDCRISAFVEKPKDPKVLAKFFSRDDAKRPFLGSMGIYVFKTSVLIDLLIKFPNYTDFGGDVIPSAIRTHNVYGYDFNGYWQDIGTIRSFYETNLELTLPDAPFNFFDPQRPIYTNPRILPGSSIQNSTLKDVLLSEGCHIVNAKISHSVIGLRSQIGAGTRIKDTIVMGADYYEGAPRRKKGDVPLGVGRNCVIEGAILDKNARLGDGVIIRSFPRGTDIDAGTWVVQDGIVVIPKDTIIPAGTRIEPVNHKQSSRRKVDTDG
jgi:glucose-1-phosphate adenylyltransferase